LDPTPGPTPISVTGDPVTVFHGKRTQFWIPDGIFVELIAVGGDVLHGMANAWSLVGDHQWFTKFKVEVQGREAVRVAARPDLLAKASADDTQLRGPKPLQTLDIRLDGVFEKNVTGQQKAGGGTVVVTAQRQRTRLGRTFKEMVTIETENMAVALFSSSATKFSDEALQLRNVHLDMMLTNVDLDKSSGVLPELWGIRPMSRQVMAMLSNPKHLHGVSK